ncbi:hypothetical protein ACE1CB_19530 [Aerosakkonema sp. BLCC-F2]
MSRSFHPSANYLPFNQVGVGRLTDANRPCGWDCGSDMAFMKPKGCNAFPAVNGCVSLHIGSLLLM